jgi:hypothetical protein
VSNKLDFLIDRDISGIFSKGKFPTKVYRQENGVCRVQTLTPMPGVTPEMVRWWFAAYMSTSEHYQRWHPSAHVWMDWENKTPNEIIGASHLVHEYIGAQMNKLRIQFVEPESLLGKIPALTDRVIIAAKAGLLERPINATTMCQIVNPIADGSEMRSVFWLGHVSKRRGNDNVPSIINKIANRPFIRKMMIKEKFAQDLLSHCQEEMAILAEFLPELYARKAKL